MRAPTYRHLDTRASIAGLTFPNEWLFVFGTAVFLAYVGLTRLGPVAGAGVYVFLRAVSYGKPEGHVQFWIMRKVRAVASKGRLTAAARVRTPPFPFAPSVYRAPGPRVQGEDR